MDLLINIDVDDLSHAVQFYTETFDFRLSRRFGEDGVELLGGTSPIYLLRKAAGTVPATGTSQPRRYERHWTPVHLDVVVQDIERAVARAVAAGARLETPTESTPWGKLALLSDPFGHGFCLVEFVGRGYDEIASNGCDAGDDA